MVTSPTITYFYSFPVRSIPKILVLSGVDTASVFCLRAERFERLLPVEITSSSISTGVLSSTSKEDRRDVGLSPLLPTLVLNLIAKWPSLVLVKTFSSVPARPASLGFILSSCF